MLDEIDRWYLDKFFPEWKKLRFIIADEVLGSIARALLKAKMYGEQECNREG